MLSSWLWRIPSVCKANNHQRSNPKNTHTNHTRGLRSGNMRVRNDQWNDPNFPHQNLQWNTVCIYLSPSTRRHPTIICIYKYQNFTKLNRFTIVEVKCPHLHVNPWLTGFKKESSNRVKHQITHSYSVTSQSVRGLDQTHVALPFLQSNKRERESIFSRSDDNHQWTRGYDACGWLKSILSCLSPASTTSKKTSKMLHRCVKWMLKNESIHPDLFSVASVVDLLLLQSRWMAHVPPFAKPVVGQFIVVQSQHYAGCCRWFWGSLLDPITACFKRHCGSNERLGRPIATSRDDANVKRQNG